jgi:L-aminopeptidase/D-esterase-like protein
MMQGSVAPKFSGSILDVSGISVGHFTDKRRPTGCTAILMTDGATASVDVRGASPGTRETDLLHPSNSIEKIHAIMLSGGSAYGLAAATGAMRFLEEKRVGVPVRHGVVPIVPSAVIYDLYEEDSVIRPDEAAGYAACAAATSSSFSQGSVGAGAGARCGKVFGFERSSKCGLGSASITLESHGVTVGAIAVCNAVGDIIDPETGSIILGAMNDDRTGYLDTTHAVLAGMRPNLIIPTSNTTLAVVATDAILTKSQAHRLAIVAQSGFARCINPVHTQNDGDVVFAVSTGKSNKTLDMITLGIMAAEVTTRAVINAAICSSQQNS